MSKYKFDEPIPTKSGRCVIEIWNELKDYKSKRAKAHFDGDKVNEIIYAKRIQKNEDDLGLTVTEFPQFGLTKSEKC